MKLKRSFYTLSTLCLILMYMGLTSCQPQKNEQQTVQVPLHPKPVETPDLFFEGIKSKFDMETIPKPTIPDDAILVTESEGGYTAVTYCQKVCEVIVFQNVTDHVQRITSSSFAPGRPFTNLQWVSDDVLDFDQWTQPHHGLRYRVNVADEELVFITLLRDKK